MAPETLAHIRRIADNPAMKKVYPDAKAALEHLTVEELDRITVAMNASEYADSYELLVIDDKSTDQMPLKTVVDMIQGEAGTKVKLAVLHEDRAHQLVSPAEPVVPLFGAGASVSPASRAPSMSPSP